MLNYICKNKITNLEEIKKFDMDGFKYENKMSEERKFVFVK